MVVQTTCGADILSAQIWLQAGRLRYKKYNIAGSFVLFAASFIGEGQGGGSFGGLAFVPALIQV